VLLASAVVLSARSARADGTPRIFPLVATLPLAPEQADTPAALTDALAALLDGVTTDRSLDAFASRLRCDVEVSTCLDAVARALVTRQLVYGTLAPAPGGKLKVRLVRFDSATTGSELFQRTFTLTAQTPKRLARQLARAAAPMFDRPVPAEPAPVPGEEPDPEPPETIDVTDAADTLDLTSEEAARARARGAGAGGRITPSTWAIVGAGAALAAGGGGFLLAARGLGDDIATAPRATATELQQLALYERAYKIRAQVGVTLLVAGGATVAAGVVRAIVQRRGGEAEPARPALALVPVAGGAALVLAGGLR
jgi:hypothetical protein